MNPRCGYCSAEIYVPSDAYCSECRRVWNEPGSLAQRRAAAVAENPLSSFPADPAILLKVFPTGVEGTENMTGAEIVEELNRGGRFVVFETCISVVYFTMQQPSKVLFLKNGDRGTRHALPCTILSLLAGWWGIPFGPIGTIGAVITNLSGGRDVTEKVLQHLAMTHQLMQAAGKQEPQGDPALEKTSSGAFRSKDADLQK